jgi:hypothetical protein
MHIADFLGQARNAERQLAESFLVVAERHQRETDVLIGAKRMAEWSRAKEADLESQAKRHGIRRSEDPEYLRAGLFQGLRLGGAGLVRDLADLRLLVQRASDAWTVLNAGAMALHEAGLEKICAEAHAQTKRQIDWIETTLKLAAPQALVAKAHPVEEIKSSLPKVPMPAALQDGMWAPLAIAALVLATGLIGMALGQAWLLPSLGPTAFLLAQSPAHPSARFWNIVAGHALGLLAGFLAVAICRASADPSVLADHILTGHRLVAAALGLGLMLAFQMPTRSLHPPAAATVMLVTLGALSSPWDALRLCAAAVVMGALGEGARRIRLLKAPFSLGPARMRIKASP